ncbi:MAG: type IV secretion system DNA-binding domain-containing protein [Vicinamibacterales bacterium]
MFTVKAHDSSSNITYFAVTNARNTRRPFGIKQADRRFHTYAIGKTGTGKSTLLKNMVLQDVRNGRGLALFDPHGDLVEEVLSCVPEHRREDVVYLDTPRGSWTFNPLSGVKLGQEALATAELIEAFKKIWIDDWGPRLEHLLRNVLFTLMELPGATLADINRLLTDRDYNQSTARTLTNADVREFWLREFSGYSPAFRAVVTAPLQNKLGAMLTDPRMHAIIGAEKTSFDLNAVMDEGKILLVNLSRGQIGEGPAMMLGALLAARIGLAGLARADRPETERRDFHLYLDEFQMFATMSLATMLAELRKYRVPLILANQYLGQLDADVRDAVLGNVGTLVCFRVSADDAAHLAREMAPVFEPVDLIQLPNHHIYLRLMIDGQVSKPFSAETRNETAYRA